jgi:hypothetical protein
MKKDLNLDLTQLTPPISNDDENKSLLSLKKSPQGQPDETNNRDISQSKFLFFLIYKKNQYLLYIRLSNTSRTIFKFNK